MTNGDTFAGLRFMRLGMLSLAVGMLFGVIGGFQFLFPDFLRELLFTKTRPLHVSLVVAWIFLIAIGGIYHYLPRQCGMKLYSARAVNWHFWIVVVTGLAIIGCSPAGGFPSPEARSDTGTPGGRGPLPHPSDVMTNRPATARTIPRY